MQIRGELYADLGYGQIKQGDGAKSQRIAAGYLRVKVLIRIQFLLFLLFKLLTQNLINLMPWIC